MMRVLLDTNIIMDALLAREPFAGQAAAIWEAHEEERFTGYLSAITPVTIFYVARKMVQKKAAVRMIKSIIETFEISPVNSTVLRLALDLESSDFEDAIQIANAIADGLDMIVHGVPRCQAA